MSETSSPSSSSSKIAENNESPGFLLRSAIKSLKLKFSSVKCVGSGTLTQWLETPGERTVHLLDCRPEYEYQVSHLDGATRVDYEASDMEEIIQKYEDRLKGKPNPTLVCYCSIGYRSSLIAEKLEKHYNHSGRQPHPEIFNLDGSIFKWANEKRPMVDADGQPTHFAHPYSAVWGKLLNKPLRKETL